MRDINTYTVSIITVGVLGFIWYVPAFSTERLVEMLLITALVIYLDIVPIKLMSGDEYSAGTIGVIYLIFELGMSAVAVQIMISMLIYFVKRYGSIRSVNWIRYLTTISMYLISAFFAFIVFQLTEGTNIIFRVFLTSLVYELINILLLAGIFKSLMGTPIFTGFYMKVRELILPVIIYMVIIPRFLFIENTKEFTIEILYTAFFLSIIIFFSSHFMNQVGINQSTNKKFIELLETRIATKLTGHGTRVGAICEVLTDLFEYPKKHRNTLVQVAIVHDIGKSLLPSHLLQKRGALTLSEEKEYRSHSDKGAEIIETIFPKPEIQGWVRYHHERWDGKGFPDGLKGEAIPLEARIISLSNQLDYLMTRHPDDSTVYQLLQQMSGTILDPTLVGKIDESVIPSIRDSLPEFPAVIDFGTELVSEQELDAKSYIGKSFFLHYADGRLGGVDADLPIKDQVVELAQAALDKQKAFHETLSEQLKTFEVHFFPCEEQVSIFIHDVTPMLMYRKKLMRDTLESYQNVIATLSKDKIQLCLEEQELSMQLGEFVDSIDIRSTSDIPLSRKFMTPYLQTAALKSKVLLALSEAATNTIKHSTGGTVRLYKKNNKLQVLVCDQGSGIPIHEIPKTVLVSGYSSKLSLGKGFLLITKSADQIYLYTSQKGTSLLMEFIDSHDD